MTAVRTPATVAAVGLVLAVAVFLGSDLAESAWGWEGTSSALYGVGSLLLVVSAGLVVATQVRLHRLHGELGRMATVGIAVSALGALLSFVSWAVVVWATVLGLGTLLFGIPLLGAGRVPRVPALLLTYAAPAVAVAAWAGVLLTNGDGSAVADGLAGAAVLVLAWGLAGAGRWMTAQA
jgi:hypothetical protein